MATNPYPKLTPLEPWDELAREQDAQLARWERDRHWRKVGRIVADVVLVGITAGLIYLFLTSMWQ